MKHLTLKQKEALSALLFERKTTSEIQEAMLSEFSLQLSHQVVSYHRGKVQPELMAADLELLQSGATRFTEQFTRLASDMGALRETIATLQPEKASFHYKIIAELQRELTKMHDSAYARVAKELDRADKASSDKWKSAIEERRIRIESEKWEIEKSQIERLRKLDELEEAQYSAGLVSPG